MKTRGIYKFNRIARKRVNRVRRAYMAADYRKGYAEGNNPLYLSLPLRLLYRYRPYGIPMREILAVRKQFRR